MSASLLCSLFQNEFQPFRMHRSFKYPGHEEQQYMKVLLINPPYPFEESPSPPFGLMALAAYLVEQGVTVKIEDYIVNPYSMDRIQEVMDTFKPDVVGATGVTMTINRSLNILRDYRSCNPNIKTVLGGPHVTFDANAILESNPWIDYIVR